MKTQKKLIEIKLANEIDKDTIIRICKDYSYDDISDVYSKADNSIIEKTIAYLKLCFNEIKEYIIEDVNEWDIEDEDRWCYSETDNNKLLWTINRINQILHDELK